MSDGFDEMIDTGRGFFAELASNNNRDWFEPRKAVYKRHHEGKVQRINRDVRFAKDKSPRTPSLNILWRRAASPLHGWLFSLSGDGVRLRRVHAFDGRALRDYRAHAARHGHALTAANAEAQAAGASLVTWATRP
jgi:hypothetical protein